ncbi:MAG: hypothetical protein RIR62_2451 [Pseudomonadota bacterium]|jgi:uncharacterized protein YdeI (BOF family)
MRHVLFVAAVFAASPALASTVAIGDLRYGTSATVTGVVDRITDEDEFRLRDDSGSVLVYIGPGIVPFDTGETVTISGIVDRDFGRLEIYAREGLRADGSRVTFDQRDD